MTRPPARPLLASAIRSRSSLAWGQTAPLTRRDASRVSLLARQYVHPHGDVAVYASGYTGRALAMDVPVSNPEQLAQADGSATAVKFAHEYLASA